MPEFCLFLISKYNSVLSEWFLKGIKYFKAFREASLPNGSNMIIMYLVSTIWSSMNYILPTRYCSKGFICNILQHCLSISSYLQCMLDKIIFLEFFDHCKNSSGLRLLHWLFLVPKTPLPQRSTQLSPAFRSLKNPILSIGLTKMVAHDSFHCISDFSYLDLALHNNCTYIINIYFSC